MSVNGRVNSGRRDNDHYWKGLLDQTIRSHAITSTNKGDEDRKNSAIERVGINLRRIGPLQGIQNVSNTLQKAVG